MHTTRALLAAGLLVLATGSALAQGTERAGKKDAIALVHRALEHIVDVGLERALDDFNRPDNDFRDRDLYVFVYDLNGNNLANSAPLDLPAFNLKGYRSADGKLVVQQMIEMTRSRGGGAFHYQWENPETGQVERKISYFRRIPGFNGFLGAGYYVE